jgi:hypothetical protein
VPEVAEQQETTVTPMERDNTTITVDQSDDLYEEKIRALEKEMLKEIEKESEKLVSEMMDENCEVNYDTDTVDEICVEDSEERTRFRDRLKGTIRSLVQVVRGTGQVDEAEEELSQGEALEKGWEQRANASPLVRNAEVWKFGLKAAVAVLNARKVKLKGATDEELREAQTKGARADY